VGLVMDEMTFEGKAPELHRIAEKVAELSGLTVAVEESAADVKGTLFDLRGRVAFASAPGEWLELFSYRPGAERACHAATFGESPTPFTPRVQGLHEPAGIQAVYLRSHLGLEPTLMGVTLLALEALGGRHRGPISPELRREYGSPITKTQFEERRRRWRKKRRAMTVLTLLVLPLAILLCFAGFLIFLALMPWQIWKAYRLYESWAETQRRNGTTP